MPHVHKMTLMIHTASDDRFLENQGVGSYFAAVLKNLSRQTMKQFELVYVDTFYEENRQAFATLTSGLGFVCKHVPVHPRHRYWYDRGNTYISAAKNTGIIYADGELLVTCDDAEFFPDNFLETYWKHYKAGRYMLAMHKRLKSLKTSEGLPVFPVEGEVYVNDHRLKSMTEPLLLHNNGSWGFAGTSFSLDDALRLNGFNERMDGCKSLEDCEFSTRLQMIGRKFVQDRDNGCLFILDHQTYSRSGPPAWESQHDRQPNEVPKTEINRKDIKNLVAVENYGVLMCTVAFKEVKANFHPVTPRHLKILKENTLKYRKFDPLLASHKDVLRTWLNVPCFDLRRQRSELRSSKEWKW